MAIGAALRSARLSGGLSVAKTSLLIGVSAATIKRWEAGQGLPANQDIQGYFSCLGVSEDSPLRQVPDANRTASRDTQGRPILRLLRAERRRNRLTLENVSHATGISIPSLHRYETGERMPDPATLRLIALASGCDEPQSNLLVNSLDSFASDPSEPLIRHYEVAGANPHFWVYGSLDTLGMARSQMNPGQIINVLHGMMLMGDHQSILETWDLLRPLARSMTWEPCDRSKLRCALLLAKLNISAGRAFFADDYAKLKREVVALPMCSDKIYCLGLVARIALVAGEAEEADSVFKRLEAFSKSANNPGLSIYCELNRLAIDCFQTPSLVNIEAVEKLLPHITGTLLIYNAQVAMTYMSFRIGDRAVLEHQIARCRETERLYGLGSPLVNRASRYLAFGA